MSSYTIFQFRKSKLANKEKSQIKEDFSNANNGDRAKPIDPEPSKSIKTVNIADVCKRFEFRNTKTLNVEKNIKSTDFASDAKQETPYEYQEQSAISESNTEQQIEQLEALSAQDHPCQAATAEEVENEDDFKKNSKRRPGEDSSVSNATDTPRRRGRLVRSSEIRRKHSSSPIQNRRKSPRKRTTLPKPNLLKKKEPKKKKRRTNEESFSVDDYGDVCVDQIRYRFLFHIHVDVVLCVGEEVGFG